MRGFVFFATTLGRESGATTMATTTAAATYTRGFVAVLRRLGVAHPGQQQWQQQWRQRAGGGALHTSPELGRRVPATWNWSPSPPPTPLLSYYNLFLHCGPSYWSWLLVLATGPGYWSLLLVLLLSAASCYCYSYCYIAIAMATASTPSLVWSLALGPLALGSLVRRSGSGLWLWALAMGCTLALGSGSGLGFRVGPGYWFRV